MKFPGNPALLLRDDAEERIKFAWVSEGSERFPGSWIFATDSATMAVVPLSEPVPAGRITKRALGLIRRAVGAAWTAEKVVVQFEDGEKILCKRPTGERPVDYEAVFPPRPSKEDALVIGLNPWQLVRLAEAMGVENEGAVKMVIDKSVGMKYNRAIHVKPTQGPASEGVIMPIIPA